MDAPHLGMPLPQHHQLLTALSHGDPLPCLARSMPRDGCPPPGHASYPHQVIAWSISHLGMPCQDVAGISQHHQLGACPSMDAPHLGGMPRTPIKL